MHLPWYVPAIAAAVVWGLHYPLIEHALRRVSLPTVVLLSALPMALVGRCSWLPVPCSSSSTAAEENRMLLALLLSTVLVTACVFIHYEVLRFTSTLLGRLTMPPRPRILI